eukprot:gene1026-4262_t
MDDVILDSIVIDVSGNGLDEHVVISRAGRKLSETLEEVKHHVNSVISEHMSSDVAGKEDDAEEYLEEEDEESTNDMECSPMDTKKPKQNTNS